MSTIGPVELRQMIQAYSLKEPHLKPNEVSLRKRLSAAETMEEITAVIKDYIVKAIDQKDEVNCKRLNEALKFMIPLLEVPLTNTPSELVKAANAALIQCASDRYYVNGPNTELGQKWRVINSLLTFGFNEEALSKVKALAQSSSKDEIALLESLLSTVNNNADYMLAMSHIHALKEDLKKQIKDMPTTLMTNSEQYRNAGYKDQTALVDFMFSKIELLKKIALDYPEDDKIRKDAINCLKKLTTDASLPEFITNRAKETLSDMRSYSAPALLETVQATPKTPRQRNPSITIGAKQHMTSAVTISKADSAKKSTWVEGKVPDKKDKPKL